MTATGLYRALNRVPRLATAIAVTVALANTARPAGALPAYLTAFEAQYPAAAGSRIDSCTLCHTTVPALNPYGTAYAGSAHEFGPIENLDSDGDGFSNLAEIQALTFPGDAGDTPAASPSPTTTVLSATPTPTTGQTPTGTPSGSPTASPPSGSPTASPPSGSPTNTSGSHTLTPTAASGSPTATKPVNTPTAGTPSHGSPTSSPTTTAVRSATSVSTPRANDDDGCNIVAPERSRTGGRLALLLAPALLLWARRRRL